MPKQSVVDMLKRPVIKPATSEPHPMSSLLENEMHDMVMERLEKKALDRAMTGLQPRIDEAESKAKEALDKLVAIQAELESTKSSLAASQSTVKALEKRVSEESKAKDAANRLCDEECQRSLDYEKKVIDLTARLAEMEKHNAMFKASMAEFGKSKEVSRPTINIPEFGFEVMSRDLNGAIKSVILKPKK